MRALKVLKEQLEEAERERRRSAEKIKKLEQTLQEYMMSEGKKRSRVARRIDSDSDISADERGAKKRVRNKSPSLSPKKRMGKKAPTPPPFLSRELNTDVEVEDTGTEAPMSSSGVELPPTEFLPPAVRYEGSRRFSKTLMYLI